jgi:SAM-dependent MidA family methyltransferase
MNDIELHIRQHARLHGPMSLATFFHLAISGRTDSYYASRDPIGPGGDFITSPEISQVFGECIGAWCIDIWEQLGSPADFNLVELGPGRGTLMSDILRSGRVRPGFVRGAQVSLVETSPHLMQVQRQCLSVSEAGSIRWHAVIDAVPEGLPTIVVSNEFFDALPARQFIRSRGRWLERVIALDAHDKLVFGANTEADYSALVPSRMRDAAELSIFEYCEPAWRIACSIGERLRRDRGAVLAIDYGHSGPSVGETLQAVRNHAVADVLSAPGDSDLTFHVDFDLLARGFSSAGIHVWPLADQRAFLFETGVTERTEVLLRLSSEAQAGQLRRALARLTAPDAMGTLFKVICATFPDTLKPAGFHS